MFKSQQLPLIKKPLTAMLFVAKQVQVPSRDYNDLSSLFFTSVVEDTSQCSALSKVIDVLNESLLSNHSPKMSFCTFVSCCFFPSQESLLCYLPSQCLFSLLEFKHLKSCPAAATSQLEQISHFFCIFTILRKSNKNSCLMQSLNSEHEAHIWNLLLFIFK